MGYGPAAIPGLEPPVCGGGDCGRLRRVVSSADVAAGSPAAVLGGGAASGRSIRTVAQPVLAGGGGGVVVINCARSIFYASHRIAGPLYRFRRIFHSVASGDLTVRTSIRKSDYLHAEAQCLEEMVSALREKIGRIEAHHADMASQLERLKAAVASGALREVEQEADRLRATVEQLTQAMEPFQTKSEPAEPRPAPLPTAAGF